MGIYTVGSDAFWWDGPTYQRPPFGVADTPSVAPYPPFVDIRAGGTIYLSPPTFVLPIIALEYKLDRYVDGEGPTQTPATGSPLESWELSVAPDEVPTVVLGLDTAGTELSVQCRAQDRGQRWSGWITSGSVDIIIGALSPGFTDDPAQTGADTNVGTLRTCDGGTVTGTPAPNITYQWLRNGVAISGATAATYTLVTADYQQSVACRVTAMNSGGTAVAVSNAITVTSATIVFPGYVARSQFVVTETSTTTGIIGTRQMRVGTDAGGSAVTIPPGFTLRRFSSSVPGGTGTISASSPAVAASDTIEYTASYPISTVRYHGLVWWHDATGTWQYATDQSDTVTIGGGTYPYGTVVIDNGGVVVPANPIDALGTPTSTGFYEVAIAAVLPAAAVKGSGTIANTMNGVYSANSSIALGFGCLKGNTAARARAIAMAENVLLSNSKCPLNCAGFYSNTSNPLNTMFVCMKLDPTTWASLSANMKARMDVAMKVALFSGAFVGSDNQAWATGKSRTLRGWPGGGSGMSQKTAGYNQGGQGPCELLNGLAYFGSVAAAKAVLAQTPAAIRAEILAAGFSTTSNLYLTMNWQHSNFVGTRDLGTDIPSAAPTDAQIVTAVTNFLYFGHPLEDYHRILAMQVWSRDTPDKGNRPWTANGVYGDDIYGAHGASGPIVIGRGWGGQGIKASTGLAVTSGADAGMLLASKANPPYMGQQGAPAELLGGQQDEGPRASPHYTIEGMRSLVGAWLSLWVAGLINPANADMVEAIPIMHRGVRVTNHMVTQGFISYEHDTVGATWPVSNQDWQRHSVVGNCGRAAGGNLFAVWEEGIYPALAA